MASILGCGKPSRNHFQSFKEGQEASLTLRPMQFNVLSVACIWGWNWECRSSVRRPVENVEYDQTTACPTLLNSMDTAESAEVSVDWCFGFFFE